MISSLAHFDIRDWPTQGRRSPDVKRNVTLQEANTPMPQPAKYENAAARQKAYRARREQAVREQAKQRGLPSLPPLPSLPGTQRWSAALTLAYHLVEEVGEQMQTYFDERSEVWQESERAQDFITRLEAVEQAREALDALL